MEHPGFFNIRQQVTLGELAEKTGAQLSDSGASQKPISCVATLMNAKSDNIAFLDNRKYIKAAEVTNAGACYIKEELSDRLPENVVRLVVGEPYRAHAQTLSYMYEEVTAASLNDEYDQVNGGFVAKSAKLEEGVTVSAGAVVEPEAEIGSGTIIGSGAVVGCRCTIGRNSLLSANSSLSHSFVGDNVILHSGSAIGQDGFGFAMGATHLKVPQIGSVIIQDNVEIGANTTVDRGAIGNTVIGEGTKIDNLVQIGHNVQIGRHCIIVAHTGVSGSTTLEDYVVLGGQVGVIGHITIGQGAQVAASGRVAKSIPAGEIYGGAPAKPVRQWQREVAAVKALALRKKK